MEYNLSDIIFLTDYCTILYNTVEYSLLEIKVDSVLNEIYATERSYYKYPVYYIFFQIYISSLFRL